MRKPVYGQFYEGNRILSGVRPGRQLIANIIGRANEAILGQAAAKEGQLAQADGPGLLLYPSVSGQPDAPH